MSKKSPLKQMWSETLKPPSIKPYQDLTLGPEGWEVVDKEWYFSKENLGEPPKASQLSEEQVESIIKKMLAQGHNQGTIVNVINSIRKDKNNAYNSRVKLYNEKLEKFKSSEKKIIENKVNSYRKLGWDEGKLTQLSSLLTEQKEKGIDYEGDFDIEYENEDGRKVYESELDNRFFKGFEGTIFGYDKKDGKIVTSTEAQDYIKERLEEVEYNKVTNKNLKWEEEAVQKIIENKTKNLDWDGGEFKVEQFGIGDNVRLLFTDKDGVKYTEEINVDFGNDFNSDEATSAVDKINKFITRHKKSRFTTKDELELAKDNPYYINNEMYSHNEVVEMWKENRGYTHEDLYEKDELGNIIFDENGMSIPKKNIVSDFEKYVKSVADTDRLGRVGNLSNPFSRQDYDTKAIHTISGGSELATLEQFWNKGEDEVVTILDNMGVTTYVPTAGFDDLVHYSIGNIQGEIDLGTDQGKQELRKIEDYLLNRSDEEAENDIITDTLSDLVSSTQKRDDTGKWKKYNMLESNSDIPSFMLKENGGFLNNDDNLYYKLKTTTRGFDPIYNEIGEIVVDPKNAPKSFTEEIGLDGINIKYQDNEESIVQFYANINGEDVPLDMSFAQGVFRKENWVGDDATFKGENINDYIESFLETGKKSFIGGGDSDWWRTALEYGASTYFLGSTHAISYILPLSNPAGITAPVNASPKKMFIRSLVSSLPEKSRQNARNVITEKAFQYREDIKNEAIDNIKNESELIGTDDFILQQALTNGGEAVDYFSNVMGNNFSNLDDEGAYKHSTKTGLNIDLVISNRNRLKQLGLSEEGLEMYDEYFADEWERPGFFDRDNKFLDFKSYRKEGWEEQRLNKVLNIEDFVETLEGNDQDLVGDFFYARVADKEEGMSDEMLANIDHWNNSLMNVDQTLIAVEENRLMEGDKRVGNLNGGSISYGSLSNMYTLDKQQTNIIQRNKEADFVYKLNNQDFTARFKQIGEDLLEEGYYVKRENNNYLVVDKDGNFENGKYQEKLNNLKTHVELNTNNYVKLREETLEELGSLHKLKGGQKDLQHVSDMDNFGFWGTFIPTAADSFENMALAIPMLFGSDAAINAYSSNQRGLDLILPTRMDYSDAVKNELFGEFYGRTLGEQAANMTLAVGSAGIGSLAGTSAATLTTIQSIMFGTLAAGTKMGELEIAQERGNWALGELRKLEDFKDLLPPEDYKKQKRYLNEIVQENHTTYLQRLGSSLTTGLIEGAVMKFLGTAVNANRFFRIGAPGSAIDDVVNAAVNGTNNASRSALARFSHGFVNFGKEALKGTAGEVAEETLIEFGSMLGDMMWLDKDFDVSQLDDVAVASILTGGTMNTVGGGLSSLMNAGKTNEWVQHVKPYVEKLYDLRERLDNLPVDATASRDEIHTQIAMIENNLDQHGKGLANTIRLLGAEDIKKLIAYQQVGNSLLAMAGINASMNEDQINRTIEKYKKKIGPKKAKEFQANLDAVSLGKKRLIGSVKYDKNSIEKLFGQRGLEIAEDLKDNNDFNKADFRGKAAMVSQVVEQQMTENTANRMRQSKYFSDQVERKVYEGKTWEQYKKETGRKNRKRAQENELYNMYAPHVLMQATNSKMVYDKNITNASAILGEINIEDLKNNIITQDPNLSKKGRKNQLRKQLMDMRNEDGDRLVTDEDIGMYLSMFERGELPGLLIGNKYIVQDRDAAMERLNRGDLVQGTVISHELSHVLDNLAFQGKDIKETRKNISNYSEHLYDYMSRNMPGFHDNAIRNLKLNYGQDFFGKRGWKENVDFKKQSDMIKDEYTKKIQDAIEGNIESINEYGIHSMSNELKKQMNVRVSLKNLYGKYKVNSGKDAWYYMANYIKAKREGKLSKVQKKMVAGKKLQPTQETVASRIKVEIEQVIGKDNRKKLVEKVNETYSKIIDLQKELNDPNLNDVQKSSINQKINDLKSEIAEQYRPMAEKRFSENLATAPSVQQRENLERNSYDIVTEILYDPGQPSKREEGKINKSRSVLGMINDFQIERHSYGNLAAYINAHFKWRSLEVFARYDTAFEQRADDAMGQLEQLTEEMDIGGDTGPIQSGDVLLTGRFSELETNPIVLNKINEINENIVNEITNNPALYEGKNYKTLSDLNPLLTVQMMIGDPNLTYIDDGSAFWKSKKGKALLGTSVAESIVKKLTNNDNLNQQDVKALQRFIFKHNDVLWKMLPEGFMTKMVKQKDGTEVSRPDKATGVQNVLLEPFYNRSSKRVGNGYPQYKKPLTSVSPQDFLDVFGITPRGEMNIIGKESNVSQRIKALIQQTGKTITNQTTRRYLLDKGSMVDKARLDLENGKSQVMFSREIATNLDIPNIKEKYTNFITLVNDQLPWDTFTPSKKFNKDKDLKQTLKNLMKEADIPLTLQSKLLNEMTNNTGQLVNMSNMKRVRDESGMQKEEYDNIIITDIVNQTNNEFLKNRSLQEILNTPFSASVTMSNPDNIDISREDVTRQVQTEIKNQGIELTEEGWNNAMKDLKLFVDSDGKKGNNNIVNVVQYIYDLTDQYASMGRIHNGLISITKEGGNTFNIQPDNINPEVSTTPRKQIFEGIGDFMFFVNRSIMGNDGNFIEIIPMKKSNEVRSRHNITREKTTTKYGWGSKEFQAMYPGFTSKRLDESSEAVMKEADIIDGIPTLGSFYEKRQEQALYFREHLKKQTKHIFDRALDKDDSFGKANVFVWLMGLGSGMKTASRRAAPVAGIADGVFDAKNPGKDLEYDHLKPNHVLMQKLAKLYIDLSNGEITMNEVNTELDTFFIDYVVNIIPKKMDNVAKRSGVQSFMQLGYIEGGILRMEDGAYGRLYSDRTKWHEEMRAITLLDPALEGKRFGEDYVKPSYANKSIEQHSRDIIIGDAVLASRSIRDTVGISVWDFDDTLAKSKSNILYTTPDGRTGKLTAEEFAKDGARLLEEGYVYDFSEFSQVIDGEAGPLLEKFKNRIEKYGVENNFILTARPVDSNIAIHEFLKSQGINLPIKNITGLANSTAEAKAEWILKKVEEGYNDFYFADDATANVEAVKNVLEQVDVKSKVQQAKAQFSREIEFNMNSMLDLNRILEQTKGVDVNTRFSEAQAKIRGSKKGRFAFWVPPSAEDFKGLIYRFIGKGKEGDAQLAFFKKALFDPYARGYEGINATRQNLNDEYRMILKAYPNIKKLLKRKVEGTNFTVANAIRVHLWDKNNIEIPGISKRDLKTLTEFVRTDVDLTSFADSLGIISRQEEGYLAPNEYWTIENIQSDINRLVGEVGREKHLAEWKANVEEIFGTWDNGRLVGPNMNKIEAIYGSRFREALEDILWRMEFGSNRNRGNNRLVNAFNNWANQSVGAIMFFNMRSALLQTISAVNFINWSDNNMLKASVAFANQPQFWRDFAYIFNSDMLKQRRAGNQRGINEAELAEAVAGSSNKAKAAISWLLTKGFLPTQIADSFAIASGGATFYRNRIKTYLKQGFDQKTAEEKAWKDFQEIAEETQQSSRPDLISQQQASPLGRYLLAFKNTPMQYARLIKKAWLDIVNNRGDLKTNISKIIYYMAMQNFIFTALQQALFAMTGDEEEEKETARYEKLANGMIDSILGGLGLAGNAVMTIKNMLLEYVKQEKKGWNADHTYTMLKMAGFSPTIGSKMRKIYKAIEERKYNQDIMGEMSTFDIDNPIWPIIGNVVSGATNVPLDRLFRKIDNVEVAITEDIEAWQRLALLMGWTKWELGVEEQDILEIEEVVKTKKKIERKKKQEIKKEEKKKELKKENQRKEQENRDKNDGGCIAISRSGNRCKNEAESGGYCTIHAKVDKRTDGRKTQCTKIKSNGERCKMKTSASSGLCYYHD